MVSAKSARNMLWQHVDCKLPHHNCTQHNILRIMPSNSVEAGSQQAASNQYALVTQRCFMRMTTTAGWRHSHLKPKCQTCCNVCLWYTRQELHWHWSHLLRLAGGLDFVAALEGCPRPRLDEAAVSSAVAGGAFSSSSASSSSLAGLAGPCRQTRHLHPLSHGIAAFQEQLLRKCLDTHGRLQAMLPSTHASADCYQDPEIAGIMTACLGLGGRLRRSRAVSFGSRRPGRRRCLLLTLRQHLDRLHFIRRAPHGSLHAMPNQASLRHSCSCITHHAQEHLGSTILHMSALSIGPRLLLQKFPHAQWLRRVIGALISEKARLAVRHTHHLGRSVGLELLGAIAALLGSCALGALFSSLSTGISSLQCMLSMSHANDSQLEPSAWCSGNMRNRLLSALGCNRGMSKALCICGACCLASQWIAIKMLSTRGARHLLLSFLSLLHQKTRRMAW